MLSSSVLERVVVVAASTELNPDQFSSHQHGIRLVPEVVPRSLSYRGIEEVPTESLVTSQVGVDAEKVDSMADNYEDPSDAGEFGEHVPSVRRWSDDLHEVTDGNHRLIAQRKLGRTSHRVAVWE